MKVIESFRPSIILCPIDFSELSDLALKYAAAGARAFGARMVVFHAQRFLLPAYFTSSQITELTRQRRGEKARATEFLRLHLKKILGPTAEGIRIKLEIEDAHPVDAILAAAARHQADLIVMGTHGRGGAKRLWLGSVAENVVRQAQVPVFAVRQKQHDFVDTSDPRNTPELKTILCPVDFRPAARTSLSRAVSLATQFGARLVTACVSGADKQDRTQAREQLESWLQESNAGECEVEIRGARGDTGKQMVALVSKMRADLVVLGAQPRSALHHWLWSDATEYVLRYAPAPVLVVPPEESMRSAVPLPS